MIPLQVGDSIRDLQIRRHLAKGRFSDALLARDEDGADLFVKQYKTPSCRKPWFERFVVHLREVQLALFAYDAEPFAVPLRTSFVARHRIDHAFAVYNYVPRATTLAPLAGTPPGKVRRRLLLARKLAIAIAAVHRAGLVYSDMKPANVLVVGAPDEKHERLLLTDTDFAFFEDEAPPWATDLGYVGSPGYFSPEHSGGVPSRASDVFSTALVIHELLTGRHPFPQDGDAYTRAVRSGPPALRLDSKLPEGIARELTTGLRKALSPDPRGRPTAAELEAILGRCTGEAPAKQPAVVPSVRLVGARGRLTMNVGAALTPALLAPLIGDDKRFWGSRQATLERRETGWYLVPDRSATNDLLLDGRLVEKEVPVGNGAVIGVGRAFRNLVRGAVRVEFLEEEPC